MHRLVMPVIALTAACVDKTDTDTDLGTDTDVGTDSDFGTDTDVGTDTDADTADATVMVTVYVADTLGQPLADASVTLNGSDATPTNTAGFVHAEVEGGESVDVVVVTPGFTRHYETAAVNDGEASVFAVLNPAQRLTVTSTVDDEIITTDDGFVLRLDGGFLGDVRGNETLTEVDISVYDTPERLASMPPVPEGFTLIAVADVVFTRDGEVLDFRGQADLTFPRPVGLHPSRYREMVPFFVDTDGRYYRDDADGTCSADEYRNDRTPGTLTVHVCHLSTWALLLPIRDEVCIDLDASVDGAAPAHDVRFSAISECGEGVYTSKGVDGHGEVCVPHCGPGIQSVSVQTLDTDGDSAEVAAATVRVELPEQEAITGPIAATVDLHTTSQDADGVTAAQGDCNDNDPTIFPGADDPIDDAGLDSNCDGVDGVDADRDGYSDVFDCDDTDRTIRPGRTDNGLFGIFDEEVDNDCDGSIDEDGDLDQDGFINIDFGGRDCNDRDALIRPGIQDDPGDGLDADCDGFDDAVEVFDADGDGWSSDVDCNDNCFDIFPRGIERCDSFDSDCDGRPNVTSSGLDTCLDGGAFDDEYLGVYTVEVVSEGEVVDRCSADLSLSVEDGRAPTELQLDSSGTATCDLATAFNGGTVSVQAVDGAVAPWGLSRGTAVFAIGSVVHETLFDGFVRAGRLTGTAWVDAEDDTLGPVTVRFTAATRSTADRTDALADDADFDGTPTAEDCDDNDPTRRLGATEACNGVDDNCDGNVDEDACPAQLPPAGRYGVNAELAYHLGLNDTKQAPPPPAIALLVDEEMNHAAQDNPVFQGQAGAMNNVIAGMTVTPPTGDGAVSGTLILMSDGVFPSGDLLWSGTVNADGFTGIAIQHDALLDRWTRVAFTAAPMAAPTENDADFDGTPTDMDCDDSNPNQRFGAHEVCNGLDDDCDGEEDQPLDDVCPIMDWAGESFPNVAFSILSDDGLSRWSQVVQRDVNIEQDGAFTMDNPVFQGAAGAQVNVLAMSMGTPGDNGDVTGVMTLESTTQDIPSGQVEWTGHIDSFGLSGFATVQSGPRRWTHIAISHTRDGL